MKLTMVFVTLIWGTIFSSLQWTIIAGESARADTGARVVTRCKGENLVLNEGNPEVPSRVFVYRNDRLVASTSANATRDLQGRLFVDAQSSVTLRNISTNDLGVYHVEVKGSGGSSVIHSVRLVVGEPPEIADSRLVVVSDTSEITLIRLKCGVFTFLGFPPVSVIWRDPVGQLLANTGFFEQFFTLDLPVNVARPGRYICQLDCHDPNYCCLDDQSPLRQWAQIDVQIDNKDLETSREFGVPLANFSSLVQRVQELETAATTAQDCGESGVAAMAHLVHRQAKCDQLDTFIDRLNAVEKKNQDISQRPPYGGCPVEKGYVLYNKRCLKLYTIKQDYHTARKRCETDGAHLFNFKSRELDGPPLLLLLDTNGQELSSTLGQGLWIGADDTATEGHFLWSDGTTLLSDSGLWDSGQPDDAGNNEDCVEVARPSNFVINDFVCAVKLGFVCQADIEMQ